MIIDVMFSTGVFYMQEKGAVSSAEKGEKPEGTDGEEAFCSFSSLIKESKSSRDGSYRLIEHFLDWIYCHISTKYSSLLSLKIVVFKRNHPVFAPY